MASKIEGSQTKNETVQLITTEEQLSKTITSPIQEKSSQKWTDFLNDYRQKNQCDFNWVNFVKKQKLIQKDFDLRKFILTYGQAAIDSFLDCKRKFIEQRKHAQNNTVNIKSTAPLTEPTSTKPVSSPNANHQQIKEIIKLRLRNEINELRYRLLINFITPQTRLEKKVQKKWMRVCKKDHISEREAYERYLVVSPDAIKDVPGRKKLLDLLEEEQKIIEKEISDLNQSKIIGITTTVINDEKQPNETAVKAPTTNQVVSTTPTKVKDYQSKEILEEIKKIEL